MLSEKEKLLVDDLTKLLIHVRKNWQKSDEEINNSLTPPKHLILHLIYKNGKLSSSELSKQIGLSSGSITTAVNKLVDNELIKRKRDSHDRRVTWLELTDEGLQMIEELSSLRQKLWIVLFEKLSNSEKDQFHSLISKILPN